MDLMKVIDRTQDRFLSLAPSNIKFEAEKGYAIQILTSNSFLNQVAQGAQDSLAQAISNVAAIGLSLNPTKKEAYLISRNVKRQDENGRTVYQSRIFLEPSYMGLCNIATGTGIVEWIKSDIVYENDEFIVNSPGENVTHRFHALKPRGEMIGVYCVAKLKNDYLVDIMDMEEINSVMERSETIKQARKQNKAPSGPWVTDFKEMAKKTVVRRAFKMWPKTKEFDRMSEAVNISNENEGFDPIINNPNIGEYTAETKAYFDSIIEKSDDLKMYCFSKSVDENIFNNLYHSFEKGSKGKFQQIINKLLESGRTHAESICIDIISAMQSDDESAVIEIINELSKEESDVIFDSLPSDALFFVNEIMKNQAA